MSVDGTMRINVTTSVKAEVKKREVPFTVWLLGKTIQAKKKLENDEPISKRDMRFMRAIMTLQKIKEAEEKTV